MADVCIYDVCMSASMYACIDVSMYVSTYYECVCVYVCIHVYMSIFIILFTKVVVLGIPHKSENRNVHV